MWQNDFSELLRRQYANKKKRNPRFSVRAFAKQLEVSPSALSNLLNQKKTWTLSSQRAIQILDKLPIGPIARGRMLMSMNQQPNLQREILSPEANRFMLDWRHMSVCSALGLPLEYRTEESLCRRFGLKPAELETICQNLLKLNLVERDLQTKTWRRKEGVWLTEDIPSEVMREQHVRHLDLARDALESVPRELRDFTLLSFVGSPERLGLLREEVMKFYERVMLIMDGDEKNSEVYRVSVNLFPLGSVQAGRGQKK